MEKTKKRRTDEGVTQEAATDEVPLARENARFLQRRISQFNAPVEQSVSRTSRNNFTIMQRQADLALRAMRLSCSPEVYELRMTALQERGLTNEQIQAAVEAHRKRLQTSLYDGALVSDGTVEVEVARVATLKVEDSLLQFYRVLHRRRMAVLEGRKLPPVGSVFARLPFSGLAEGLQKQ
jgi:predicted nuclease of predicted toxin-antitoxin system